MVLLQNQKGLKIPFRQTFYNVNNKKQKNALLGRRQEERKPDFKVESL